MENIERVVEIAKRAALSAGQMLRAAHASNDVSITLKEDSSLVTQYDVKSEELIVDIIRKEFPRHLFLTEEKLTTVKDSSSFDSPVWVIDPIDGTTNFAYGNVQYAVSIAYIEKRQGKVGVVYAPAVDEMFLGIKGKGAFKNNKKLTGSTTKDLSFALIATGYPTKSDGGVEGELRRIGAILNNCRDIRRFGSAALDICWIADGRQDGYFETIKPWDIAAAFVIAKEAGLFVDHLYGIPSDYPYPSDICSVGVTVAASGIGEKFFELLQQTILGE